MTYSLRSAWFIFVPMAMAVSSLHAGAVENQDALIRQTVWEIATRSPDPALPSPVDQLAQFKERSGIAQDVLQRVLLEYAKGENLPAQYGSEVSAFATRVLADWRCPDVLPILLPQALEDVDASDETARNARYGALALVMRVGGVQALNLAETVFTNRQKYSPLDRFYVCQNLARHLTPLPAQGMDKEFGADATALFERMIKEEDYVASVEVMDKALATVSEEYCTSERRKNILLKHENTEAPYQRKYFRESLQQIAPGGSSSGPVR